MCNILFIHYIFGLLAILLSYKAKSKIQKTVTLILEMYSMFFCHHCFKLCSEYILQLMYPSHLWITPTRKNYFPIHFLVLT